MIFMAKRRRKKNKGNPLFSFIILAIITATGYYAYQNPKETKKLVNKHAPTVKKIGNKSLSTSKTLVTKAIEKISDFAESKKKPTEPQHSEPKISGPKTIDIPPSSRSSIKTINTNGEELKLCSFNIRIYSNKSRDDDELNKIAELLDMCDITAIQEVRDETVLKRTVNILAEQGSLYDYVISKNVGRGVKERYAFLYNPRKVQLTSAARVYDDTQDVFIREPYYASFRAGNFDFTLLTIHLLFGKSKSDRRPELKYLAQAYEDIKKSDPKEKDVIVLGDFNFPPTDVGWSQLKDHQSMTHLISPPAKTTITDTSLYDNFWFQSNYTKEYTGNHGIIHFDETMFGNNDRQAKLTVSDHRPIWATFSTIDQDDD